MAGNQHGDVLLALGEKFEEYLARFRIEVGGGFVHHQHLRIAPERNCDQQLLLHAAGELDERARQDRCQIEAQALCQFMNASRVCVAQCCGEVDQLRHRHFQRRRQLRHETDRPQHCRALLARITPLDGDLAVEGIFAQQAADQRGLAGAVGADQCNALGQSDLEADVVEYARLAKAFCYA